MFHRMLAAWLITASVCAVAVLQEQEKKKEPAWAVKFEDYAVADVFHGKPAPPILTRDHWSFRTRIRYGAAKGPNFAGHYTLVGWGCGAGCVATVLVDARSGRIYNMPFGSIATYDGKNEYQGPLYRLNSRLLIADGCPNEAEKCGTYYYQWTANTFKLLRYDGLKVKAK